MPAALRVNFAASSRRVGTGAILFVLGVLACVSAVLAHVRLGHQLERVQTELVVAQRMDTARRGPTLLEPAKFKAAKARIEAYNQVLDVLERSWFDLLHAVEEAHLQGITLLAIDADAATGQARLAGEALNLETLGRYLDRLGQSMGLRDVRLVQSELSERAERGAIRFTLATHWQSPR